jgi:tetratricopeptide (TPR) repeat protein
MMKTSLLRIYIVGAMTVLLTACGSIEKQGTGPTEVPVEERDHGSISTYRFIPPPPPAEEKAIPGRAPTSSAVARLHTDAKKQLASKQYNAAASTLERALRIAPRNAELWHSLAVVRLQQQRWDMARNMAAKSNSLATADRPLQARNWRLIANSHRAQGNQQAAQQAWQRVRALGGS